MQVFVQGARKTRSEKHSHRNQNRQNNGKRRRVERSVSLQRHVEALVVADPSMIQFHESGDVETYLLTIMNMVSALFKDPTIGNSVQIAIVKIILLEEEDSYQDLNVTHIAATTLESFCR